VWGECRERSERYKNITFITYPYENKELVNVVNVGRRFLHLRRTLNAKWPLRVATAKDDCEFWATPSFNHSITRLPNHSILEFPVNSLFLCIGMVKSRDPKGFSGERKKIPCYFPCYWEIWSYRFSSRMRQTRAISSLSCGLRRVNSTP